MVNHTLERYVLSTYLFKSTTFVRTSLGKLAADIKDMVQSFKARSTLQQEIKALKNEITQYQKSFKSIDALLYENHRLKELLKFSLSVNYTLLPSRIIADGSIQHSTRFLINRGSDSGVEKDMAVCAIYQNQLILLGKIILVSAKESFFVSVTDVNSYVPVITSESRQQGILQGSGDTQNTMILKMDDISGLKQIFVGEMLLIHEYSTVFPHGIPVGEISDISVDERDRLLQARATPYMRANTVDIVFVMIPE